MNTEQIFGEAADALLKEELSHETSEVKANKSCQDLFDDGE